MPSARWRKVNTFGTGWATQARCGHTATLFGKKMVVIGGGNPVTPGTANYPIVVYDLDSQLWTLINFIFGLKYHTATLVEDKVLCIGGGIEGIEGSTDRLMAVAEVDLIFMKANIVETYLHHSKDMPSHTWKHVAEFFEAKREIVVHGGRPKMRNARASEQLFALDVDSKVWRKLSYKGAPPRAQASHMSCLNATGDGMFVFASYDSDPTLSELYLFDYRGRVPKWEHVKIGGTLPPGLYGGCLSLVHQRYLILFAGTVDGQIRDDVYQYDVHTSRWAVGIYDGENAEFKVKGSRPPVKSRHSGVVWNGSILYIGGVGLLNESISEFHWLDIEL